MSGQGLSRWRCRYHTITFCDNEPKWGYVKGWTCRDCIAGKWNQCTHYRTGGCNNPKCTDLCGITQWRTNQWQEILCIPCQESQERDNPPCSVTLLAEEAQRLQNLLEAQQRERDREAEQKQREIEAEINRQKQRDLEGDNDKQEYYQGSEGDGDDNDKQEDYQGSEGDVGDGEAGNEVVDGQGGGSGSKMY